MTTTEHYRHAGAVVVTTRANRRRTAVLLFIAVVIFMILGYLSLQASASRWRNSTQAASGGPGVLVTTTFTAATATGEPPRSLISMIFEDSLTPLPATESTSNSMPQQAENDEDDHDDDHDHASKNEDGSFIDESSPPPLVPLLQYVLTTCPLNRRFEPMAGMIRDADNSVLTTSKTNNTQQEDAAAWQCGRALGLRLEDNVEESHDEPPILETGILSGLADYFISSNNSIINDHIDHNNNSSSVNKTQQQEQDRVGLAMSLWLIPAANKSLDDSTKKVQYQQEPIFTLAAPQSKEKAKSGGSTSCFGSYNLQIAQYQNRFLLRYTDNDAARSCRVLYIQQWDLWSQESNNASTQESNYASTNSSLPEDEEQYQPQQQHSTMVTHLVVVLGAGETSIFINGQGVPPLVGLRNELSASSSIPLLSHWSQDLRLQLFGTTAAANTAVTPQQPPRFAGSIHQVALYNQTLSPAQVDALFRQGPVNVTQLWNNTTNNNTSNESFPALIVDIPRTAVIIPQHVVQEHNQPSALVVLSTPNISNTVWQLAMEIVSIPSHGQLARITTIGGQDQTSVPLPPTPLSVGDLVRLPVGASNVTVEYSFVAIQACPNKTNSDLGEKAETNFKEEDVCYTFFNEPRFNAYGTDLRNPHESFSYRLTALDADGYPLVRQKLQQHSQEPLATEDDASAIWASGVVSQPILVQHVNHVPILTIPSQDDLILMSKMVDDSARVLFIEGISLSDPMDFNINRIRVDIWTRGGTTAGRVALNRQYLHLADFKECSGRTDSAWQCVGGGIDDERYSGASQTTHRRMTFIAIPDDVNLILHRLQYHYDTAASRRGADGGQADEVIVIGLSVYDGQGGDCLSTQEHAVWDERVGNTVPTRHASGCFKVEALIYVPALAAASGDDSGNDAQDDTGFFNTDLDSFGVADLLFWCFAILILCVMCCCIERLRHCPIGILDADNDDNVSAADDSSLSSIGDVGHTKRVCNHCTCKAQDIL